MMTVDFRACLPILITITTWVFFPHSEAASDDVHQSSRVGALRLPLVASERIPIATVLAHPDRYEMREIRLTGTVMTIETETLTNRLICGRAHERTALTVEDDSGQIEIIDQGACGRNVSSLKASMLKVGQQIDLLVLIVIPASSASAGSSLEATIRFLDLARN